MQTIVPSIDGASAKQQPCVGVLRVPFPSARLAGVARDCMEVDDELQADKISREMHVDAASNTLVVTFRAENAKLLRVSMSSFMDMLLVSIKTMLEFDE